MTLENLGRAEKVVVTKDHTTILVNKMTPELEERIKVLQAKIEITENTFEKDKLKERLAKLAGGVAVIEVGASSEVEMREKKLRIEDALNATKAAVKEGIVAGGGVALLKAYVNLTKEDRVAGPNADFEVGYNIVINTLDAPIKQIAENAGVDGSVVAFNILSGNAEGYDALTDSYVNMFEAGILDPTTVTKTALINAGSVASMLLTTEGAVVEKVKEETAV